MREKCKIHTEHKGPGQYYPNIPSTIRLLPQALLRSGPSASLYTHLLTPLDTGPAHSSSLSRPVLWQLRGVITGASGAHPMIIIISRTQETIIDLASSREMSLSLSVNPSILCLNPARKLCYYGGKLRKIFGCIEFKLELTRAITDKKNARNVGECITETHPSQVTASLTRHQVPLVCVKLRSGWPILRGEQG